MIGFGMAAAKPEGGKVKFDARDRRTKRRGVGTDWMEIPVPKNASRARVHKLVDAWLDQRANGFKGLA